ncbi:MAG: hypothetical protein JJT75_11720 [Opitutales bacterium]|nr:hypothetical protein [Opitutales bacterium]MCH8540943.1 hypothetical protein [Opitutales bacterium]
MKKLISSCLVGSTLALSSLQGDVPPLADIAPADAPFLIDIPNIGEWQDKFLASPFYHHRDAPEMEALKRFYREEIEEGLEEMLEEMGGVTLEELFSLFSLRLGATMTRPLDFGALSDDPDEYEVFTLFNGTFLLAEVGENREAVESFFAKLEEAMADEEDPHWVTEDIEILGFPFLLEKAHPDIPESGSLISGFWEDYFLAGIGEVAFTETLHYLLEGGRPDSLSLESEFQSIVANLPPEQDTLFFFNVEATFQPLFDAFVEGFQQGLGMMEAGWAENLDEILGFSTLRNFYISAGWLPEGLSVETGIRHHGKKGFFNLFTTAGPAPEIPPYFPAEASQAQLFTFSMEDFWRELQGFLDSIDPDINAQMRNGLNMMRGMGIDLEEGLIRALGQEHFVLTFTPEELNEDIGAAIFYLVGLSLQNSAALENLIHTARMMAGPMIGDIFHETDFLGTTVVTVTDPMAMDEHGGVGFHYAFADGYFLLTIGERESLLNFLRAKSGDLGRSFLDEPGVDQLLADFPDRGTGYTVTRTPDFIYGLWNQFYQEARKFDPDAAVAPPAKEFLAKFVGNAISIFHDEPNAFRFRYFLEIPEVE